MRHSLPYVSSVFATSMFVYVFHWYYGTLLICVIGCIGLWTNSCPKPATMGYILQSIMYLFLYILCIVDYHLVYMAVSRCPICNGGLLRHSVKLECDSCSKSIHIQCLPVDKEEYDVIIKRNHGWAYSYFCGILYAFNGIADDHCFASALYELISNIPVSMSTILRMIFDPLTLNDKSNIPLSETDPDIQFYYELRIMYNENGNYILKTSLVNYHIIQNVRKIYHFCMLI